MKKKLGYLTYHSLNTSKMKKERAWQGYHKRVKKDYNYYIHFGSKTRGKKRLCNG